MLLCTKNFKSFKKSVIPIFCDEGVFRAVTVIMVDPNEFYETHGMVLMFHWVKILLESVGWYLRGSRVEDPRQESVA